MSADTLRILRLRARGIDPEAMLERVAETKRQEVDAQVQAARRASLVQQAVIEHEANLLLAEMRALDVSGPQTRVLEALEQDVRTLRITQRSLHEGLAQKQEESKQKSMEVANVKSEVHNLSRQVRQVRSPLEASVFELGGKISSCIGQQ